MSTDGKMSLMDFLKRGLRFKVCGQIGGVLKIDDERSGETSRFVRIEGFGRTYNLSVETDEELAKFKELEGSPVRASGKLGRRRGAAAGVARLDTVLLPGLPGWKDLTDAEIQEGCTFDGTGLVTEKRFSEFRGQAYRSLQLGVMGETFLFQEIDPDLFGRIPETGAVKVSGKLHTKIVGGSTGKVSDLIFRLDEARAQGALGESRPEPPGEKKTA